jgi:hypothetical protein
MAMYVESDENMCIFHFTLLSLEICFGGPNSRVTTCSGVMTIFSPKDAPVNPK